MNNTFSLSTGAFALGALLWATTGSAADSLPPCWRGQTGTTLQAWTFNSSANPAAPEQSTNAYGTASAAVVVGLAGSAWSASIVGFGTPTGIWDIGADGSITATIPNQPAVPLASSKIVWVQVVQFYDGVTFPYANIQVPGATLVGSLPVFTNEVTFPFGSWITRQTAWRLEPSPASETVAISAPGGPIGMLIDEVVVDTICLTNSNTYVDAAYSGSDCASVGWPSGAVPADKTLGLVAFAGLQTGVERAPSNGVVNVAAGVYGAVLSVTKPLTVTLGPTSAAAQVAGLTLGAAAILDMDISGVLPGTQYDQWVVASGSVNLGGAALALHCTTNLPLGTQITLIDQFFGAVSGTFAGLPQGATNTVGNQQFRISYTGGSGNDVVLMVVNHAPVPIAKLAEIQQNTTTNLYIAKLLVGATDPDPGDVVSFGSVIPTTAQGGSAAPVTFNGQPAIAYTPPLNYVGTDYFYYTLTDGRLQSTGAVQVLVRSTNAITHNILPLTFVGPDPLVRFAGVQGHTYEVQRSVDSASGPWTTIATITLSLGGNGIGQHLDNAVLVPVPTSRFYRTRHLP